MRVAAIAKKITNRHPARSSVRPYSMVHTGPDLCGDWRKLIALNTVAYGLRFQGCVAMSTRHLALSIQPMTLGGGVLPDVRFDAHVATEPAIQGITVFQRLNAD